MKVEVKKVDATKRELRFEIPKDRVTQKLDQVYGEISKEAAVKGYRPGKAPRNIIESQYGKIAQEETIKKIIPEAYQEALEQEKLEPIDLPEIHDVSFKEGALSFVAKFDIRPEVKIKDYKNIKVARKSSAVTDEELSKALEFVKKGQGEDKELTVDDNFARSVGYPSLEDFKSSLKRQMEIDKDRHNRMDVENQIVDYLLKHAQLSVPQSAVNKQLDYLVREWHERLERQGVPHDEVHKKEEEARKELLPSAERDMKIYFILDKIADEEKLTVVKNESIYHKAMAFLLKEAKWEETKA